jgi:hypothetical protein
MKRKKKPMILMSNSDYPTFVFNNLFRSVIFGHYCKNIVDAFFFLLLLPISDPCVLFFSYSLFIPRRRISWRRKRKEPSCQSKTDCRGCFSSSITALFVVEQSVAITQLNDDKNKLLILVRKKIDQYFSVILSQLDN